ncbi:MAG TPA: hypothetical protein DHV62_01300, partial [Elusimicrobia bacterium]|nr:hypothetical protein [Elusimicrobiota bacterium]
LQVCALCRKEVEIERAIGVSTEDRLPAEKIVYSELLFLLLRYERLLSVAVKKERIEEEKKLLKETVLERIKKWLFPVRISPVPLGFTEELEPDENFYRT